ncbi:sugar ABC transporter substrate-binding protein [Pseudoxanthomonas kalamensis DSM 18571]|uniref:XrtA/PEP-CTERM system exopolysaccharide export protein n=1 Tax=Pseudoxanthomonas kalamensis TaxID=289483 RepID=UPI001391CE46|nr:XrtA/PEP-CTERM system exopolysaccharide export protein [Pseudoxanthomonas kalamensis]KAF1709998.1 sugar ABC transporter substrate-binding protein [Pseudoxanthomonas kalamensis DSM 18571]
MTRIFAIAFAICIGLLLSSCASSGGNASPPPAPESAIAVDAYQIGVDDIVQVSVWRNPELGITVPVRPDGMISVPLIGDVAAAGHTPSEVGQSIQEKLAAYVRDPQVAVILTELRSHEYLSRIRVTGAVRQPVSIPYRPGMTVLDAVLAAGGLTEFAAPDRSSLYRKSGEATQSYDVRLDRILNRGDLSTNFTVAPGDVITVPERSL